MWPYCLLVWLGTLGAAAVLTGVCQPTQSLTLEGMGSIFQTEGIGCLPFRVREIIVFFLGAVTEISHLVFVFKTFMH